MSLPHYSSSYPSLLTVHGHRSLFVTLIISARFEFAQVSQAQIQGSMPDVTHAAALKMIL